MKWCKICLFAVLFAVVPRIQAEEISYSEMAKKSLPNVGKDGEFQAQLWFFERDPMWGIRYGGRPTEGLDAVHDFPRDKDAEIQIVYKNAAPDSKGLSGILYDYAIRRPDGSIVEAQHNCLGWAKKSPFPRDAFIGSCQMLSFSPSKEDPDGIYVVEVTVRDIPGKHSIFLKNTVKFQR